MLYLKIALLTLLPLGLADAPAPSPQTCDQNTFRAIQSLDLRLENPMYLAVYRPARLMSSENTAAFFPPNDGVVSLRVKTRASA